jgi:hypothetical protein
VNQSEVWLRVYCAAVAGTAADPKMNDENNVALFASEVADEALKIISKRIDLTLDMVPVAEEQAENGES